MALDKVGWGSGNKQRLRGAELGDSRQTALPTANTTCKGPEAGQRLACGAAREGPGAEGAGVVCRDSPPRRPRVLQPPNLPSPPLLVLLQAPDLLQEPASLLAQAHNLLIGVPIVLSPPHRRKSLWARYPGPCHPGCEAEPPPTPGHPISYGNRHAGWRLGCLALLGGPSLLMAGHGVLGRAQGDIVQGPGPGSTQGPTVAIPQPSAAAAPPGHPTRPVSRIGCAPFPGSLALYDIFYPREAWHTGPGAGAWRRPGSSPPPTPEPLRAPRFPVCRIAGIRVTATGRQHFPE